MGKKKKRRALTMESVQCDEARREEMYSKVNGVN